MFLHSHIRSVQNLTDKEIKKVKETLPIEVGARIKYFRNKLNLTQTELAQAVGKDRQYLYKIEKGLVTPNIVTIGCLTKAMEISLSQFFDFESD